MESCERCAPAIVSDAECSPPHPPSVVCQRSVSLSIHRNVVGSWSDSPGRRMASMQSGDEPSRVLHARPCECSARLLPVRPSVFRRCPSIIVRTLSRLYPSVFDVPEIAGPSRPPSRRWMVFILPVTRRRTPHRPKARAQWTQASAPPSPLQLNVDWQYLCNLTQPPLRRGRRQH